MSNPWSWFVDRSVKQAFRTQSDGTIAFYPFGKWADGYLVTTPEQATTLHVAMRRYTIIYLQIALVFLVIFVLVFPILINHLSPIATLFPLWALALFLFVFILAQPVAMGILFVIWQRRFRNLACNLEVLPPTFTRFHGIRTATTHVNRPSMVVRAAVSVVVAVIGLFVLIWQLNRLTRWEAVLIALVTATGLGYYVWCRLVMHARKALGASNRAEQAAKADRRYAPPA